MMKQFEVFMMKQFGVFNNSLTVLLSACEQSLRCYVYMFIYMRSSSKYVITTDRPIAIIY